MKNRDQALKELFAKLKEMHGDRFRPTTLIFAIWDQAMEGCTGDQIDAAFMSYVRSDDSNFPPSSPAVLLKHMTSHRNCAESAFRVLRGAMSQSCSRLGVAFEDPLLHCAVLELGGWVEVYGHMYDEQKREEFHDRFVKTYARIAKAPVVPHPAYLPGKHNNGEYIQVGDEDRVDAVVRSGYDPRKPELGYHFSAGAQPKLLATA